MLFVLSAIFLFLVILFCPKSEKREDVFAQITLAVITLMEVHSLWGYVTLEILNIGFELSYYAEYDFCLALGILVYWILVKGKRVQRFSANTHMWITASMLFVMVALIGITRFGSRLNLFAYCSADSANHLSAVELIFNLGQLAVGLENRYFLHLNEALLLKCIAQWVNPMSYYRVFLFAELVFLFLSGAAFYSLVNECFKTKYHVCIGVFFVFVYVLGYPLNNFLYGYEYLGASATIAIHIGYLLKKISQQEKLQGDTVVMLMLSCFAMYHCYSLLFIGILLGVGISCFAYLIYKPSWLKSIFFIGGMIFICYKCDWLWGYWNQKLEKLTEDAVMYRDLWSNMLWLFPVCWLGIRECVRKKDMIIWMFSGIFGAMGIFGWYMWNQKISAYYFYKFYFVWWYIFVFIAYVGICSFVSERNLKVIYMYLITIMLFAIFSNENVKNMNQAIDVENYLNVYGANWKILFQKEANMNKKRQELFYAAAQKVVETRGVVPYIGTWEKYWAEYYYALTNQVQDEVRFEQIWDTQYHYSNAGENINGLLQYYIYDKYDYVPYIMVERNSDAYWYGIGYYSTLEIVYENEYGFIYKR